MNEGHVIKISKCSMPIEVRRKISASEVGKVVSEESLNKFRNTVQKRVVPHKCNKCNNRDTVMCVRHNLKCLNARDIICFKKYTRRKEHPDYVRGVIVEN